MLNIDIILPENEDDVKDSIDIEENTLLYYLKKVKNKSFGFISTDLIIDDTVKELESFITTLEDLGFYIEDKNLVFGLPTEEKFVFMKTILDLLLNKMPKYRANPNLRDLYDEVKETKNKVMLHFLSIQPKKTIKDYLNEGE